MSDKNPYANRCLFSDGWLQERANGAIGKPLNACETESVCAELLLLRKAMRETTVVGGGNEEAYLKALRGEKL